MLEFLFLKKLYQKETLTQVFSCEYCENFKNTFFMAASGGTNRGAFRTLSNSYDETFLRK